MLTQATFTNFTALPNDTWRFASGINLIVGENGLGKSHALKAMYSLLKTNAHMDLTKSVLEKRYAEKLVAVMRPETLGRLVKRRQGRGRCEIALHMHESQHDAAVAFASNAKNQVELLKLPRERLCQSPAYLPSRELVTLCPWFVPLYDNYHLEFEETWRDTVSLLGNPSLKGPREKRASALLAPLEDAMGGKVAVDNATGRFYLQVAGEGRMEISLVAEGLRKMAMLARLISTGTLLEQGYLFWDEPETNLNPRLIKTIAAAIVAIARGGVQVFIASHSLFLLREIDMLLSGKALGKVERRWFALYKDGEGETQLEQSDVAEGIANLVLLDEELAQSDRYLASEGAHD